MFVQPDSVVAHVAAMRLLPAQPARPRPRRRDGQHTHCTARQAGAQQGRRSCAFGLEFQRFQERFAACDNRNVAPLICWRGADNGNSPERPHVASTRLVTRRSVALICAGPRASPGAGPAGPFLRASYRASGRAARPARPSFERAGPVAGLLPAQVCPRCR